MEINTEMEQKSHDWNCCSGSGGISWFGIILLLVGAYLLAGELGWISFSIPFWPVVLIIIGVYFIVKHRKHSC